MNGVFENDMGFIEERVYLGDSSSGFKGKRKLIRNKLVYQNPKKERFYIEENGFFERLEDGDEKILMPETKFVRKVFRYDFWKDKPVILESKRVAIPEFEKYSILEATEFIRVDGKDYVLELTEFIEEEDFVLKLTEGEDFDY